MQRTTLRSAALAAGLLVVPACGGSDATTNDSTSNGSTGGDTSDGGASDPTTGAQGESPATTTADASTGEPGTTVASDPTAASTSTTDDDTADATTVDPSTTGHVEETTSTSEPAATCDDAVQNQDESDVDCGGMLCSPCENAAACAQHTDCANNSCINNVCADPACDDGLANGDETDVDCGGGCPVCADNLACALPEDCASQVCAEAMCVPANCGDGVKNGDETDVDCGGATCDGCVGGGGCEVDTDCLSELCTANVCEATECLVDADCAAFDGECTMGDCKTPGFTCQAVPINEGQACEDNNLCVGGTVCAAGSCGGGAPVDCKALTDQCNVGVCDPGSGQCVADPLPPDTSCFESTCTANKLCGEGVCGDPDDKPFVFYEDFSDNSAGWTLDTEWALGPAKTSACGTGSPDPASDHTPTADNQVAGVVLGGCYATTVHDYYCATSPKIDISALEGAAYLSYWRWLNSDYANYVVNKIDVFDGNTNLWVNLLTTGGSPGIADQAWKFFSYDVSAYKHAAFQARWCFKVASGAFTRAGWNIDDVTVGPAACGP